MQINIGINFSEIEKQWIDKKKIKDLRKLILITQPYKIIKFNNVLVGDEPILNATNYIFIESKNILGINITKFNKIFINKIFFKYFNINITLNYPINIKGRNIIYIIFNKFKYNKKSLNLLYPKIQFEEFNPEPKIIYHTKEIYHLLIKKIVNKIGFFIKEKDKEIFEAMKNLHTNTDVNLMEKYKSDLKILLFIRKIIIFPKNNDLPNIENPFLNIKNVFTPSKQQIYSAKQIYSTIKFRNIVFYGDVGSGKTYVIASIIGSIIKQKKNIAYLTPTKILASQIIKFLRECDIPALNFQNDNLNHGIEVGTTEIFFGKYDKFDIFIFDEEHKFGLINKEKFIENKRIILVSATPIPGTIEKIRTQLYDFVSLSSNFKNIQTKVIEYDIQKLFNITSEYKKSLIICPFLSRDEYSAENIYNFFLSMKIDNIFLLHGKLTKSQQNSIIKYFSNLNSGILISTSLSDTGLNIENLKLLIVFKAEFFGFAQLYQMRGRVDRENLGDGICYFMHSPNINLKTKKRLLSFLKINDGLWLSYLDYFQRGGGRIGETQSGFSDDKLNDEDIMKVYEKLNSLSSKQISNLIELKTIYENNE